MKHAKCMIVCALLIVAAFVLSGMMAPKVEAVGNVTVSVWGFYESLLKVYYVWGEVKNVGDQAVTNLSIGVNCYDVSNALVTSIKSEVAPLGTASYGNPFVLMVGEKAPFGPEMISSTQGSQSIVHCNATVSFFDCASLPSGLQITMDRKVLGINPSLNGTIKNIGTVKADWFYIYAIGYDSNGAVIGTDLYQGADLDVNQVKTFSLSGLNMQLTEAVVNCTITAQSFATNQTDFTNAPQYTNVSDITVPEFSSALTALVLAASVTAVVILFKKWKPASKRQKSAYTRSL